MAKTMNNKMRKINFAQVETLAVNHYQRAIDNGTATKESMLEMKSVDATNSERPISLLQENYNPINTVGQVTNRCTATYTVDVTTDKGFEAFKNAFVDFKEEGTHIEYTTIWKEGYNVFKQFNMLNGRFFTIYVISPVEFEMFKDKLSHVVKSELTVEEAKQIQIDLEQLTRAWQESSIDVVKDKSKDFDIKFDQVLNNIVVKHSFIKKFKDNMNFNEDAVFTAKREGKDLPDFKFDIKGVDSEGNELTLNDIADDLIGNANMAAIEAAEEFFNGTVKTIFGMASETFLNNYVNASYISKELALFIKDIYRIINAARNENIVLEKEDYAKLRNAIYSKAFDLNVAKEDVVKIAINMAMTTAKAKWEVKEGTAKLVEIDVYEPDTNKYYDSIVKQLFANEYVYEVTGQVYRKQLDAMEVIDTITEDWTDGITKEFVDGLSTDETVVLGGKYYDFTGFMTVEETGLYVEQDIYAFEYINCFILNKTHKAGSTAKAEKFDNGEHIADMLEKNHGLENVAIIGKNANIVRTGAELTGRIAVPAGLTKQEILVNDVYSFKAKNNQQRIFLVIFE